MQNPRFYFEEPANDQQLRLLLSLYKQLRIPYNANELAHLTKWDAAERISVLRGRPAATAQELDAELVRIAHLRAEELGLSSADADEMVSDLLKSDDPTPPIGEPEPPATRGGRRRSTTVDDEGKRT
jgi:hypothetical protein